MSWGVTPVHLEEQNEVFTLFDHAVAAGKKQGLLQPGDKVVIGVRCTTWYFRKYKYVEGSGRRVREGL